MKGQVENLLSLKKQHKKASVAVQKSIDQIKAAHSKLRDISYASVDLEQLRGFEGSASKSYFKVMGNTLPTDFQFMKRSRQPATDAFNCLLNYALGIVYGHVEMALIRAGLDPYIGLLHGSAHNQLSLVFDTIELYRHWAERVVIDFAFGQKSLNTSHFDIDKQKGFWLNKSGKEVFIPFFDNYFSSNISRGLRKRNRYTQIDLEAHDFAKFVLHNVQNKLH